MAIKKVTIFYKDNNKNTLYIKDTDLKYFFSCLKADEPYYDSESKNSVWFPTHSIRYVHTQNESKDEMDKSGERIPKMSKETQETE